MYSGSNSTIKLLRIINLILFILRTKKKAKTIEFDTILPRVLSLALMERTITWSDAVVLVDLLVAVVPT